MVKETLKLHRLYGIHYQKNIREKPFHLPDLWKSYQAAFPKDHHIAVGKVTGKTNYIERFNNTLHQRVSRLVRKTLSFSKKIENHIGSIWCFIHNYNASFQI